MKARIGQVQRLFAGFFGWWFGELAALVPPPVRRLFRQTPRTVICGLSDGEMVLRSCAGDECREIGRVGLAGTDETMQRDAIRALLDRAGSNGSETVLRLPAAQALRCRLDMPLAAEPDLRQALFYQIDRATPFRPDEVYFDCRVLHRDADSKRLKAELTVVPRPVVDGALERAARWGLEPGAVDVADAESEAGPPRLNLLSGTRQASGARSWSMVNLLLAVVVVTLAGVAVYLPLERQRLASEALAAQVAEARAEADRALRLRQELDRLIDESRFLVVRKRNSPSVIQALDELTRLLPDHTYLYEFRLEGREIRIGGFSSAASSLIGLIDGSPMFRTPTFKAPVTRDPRTDLERFRLSFEVESEMGETS